MDAEKNVASMIVADTAESIVHPSSNHMETKLDVNIAALAM